MTGRLTPPCPMTASVSPLPTFIYIGDGLSDVPWQMKMMRSLRR